MDAAWYRLGYSQRIGGTQPVESSLSPQRVSADGKEGSAESLEAASAPAADLAHADPERRAGLLGPARFVAVLIALFAVGLFIASLPASYDQARAFSSAHQHAPDAVRAGLVQLGIPLSLYAAAEVTLACLLVAVYVAVGGILFQRKPADFTTLYFALTLVVFGVIWPNTLDDFVRLHPAFDLPDKALNAFGFAAFFLLLYLFPDGRFVPSWTRWFALAFVLVETFVTFFPDSPVSRSGTLEMLTLLTANGTMLYAQIHRYRHVASRVQRQQIKWVTFSLIAALLIFVVFGLAGTLPVSSRPGVGALAYQVVSLAGYIFGFMLVPVAVGIAVLRYRLWDIDVLISRTLVYVPLTALLAGLFSASSSLAQKGFLALTGSRSDISIVFSTLFVATMFTPLRQGLQGAVDRGFKIPHDPRHELHSFAARIQDIVEVLDVERVVRNMLDKVVLALEAEGGAVFLGERDHRRLVHAVGGWEHPQAITVPLTGHDSQEIGELVLGPRGDGAAYSATELAAVHEAAASVAGLLGVLGRLLG